MRAALHMILSWVAALVAGALVLAFLLGYSTAYLPPEQFWWTGPLGVALPYVSVVVGVMALGLGGWGLTQARWAFVAATAVVLLLIALRFGPRLAALTKPAALAGDLRVMTFNAPLRGPTPTAAAEGVDRAVAAAAPDILALQEPVVARYSTRNPDLVTMSAHLGALAQREVYQPPELPPPPVRIEQPILGRLPLSNLEVFAFSFSEGVQAPTHVTRARFRWQEREATIINLHLHTVSAQKPWLDGGFNLLSLASWRRYAGQYREATLRRAKEARRIRGLIEEVSGPLLVVGDFNSTPHNWAYRHIANGLHDAIAVGGRGLSGTYPSAFPLVRIDHILASPEWTIVAAHVATEYAYSDHRPVIAQLRWRAADP